jgi:signal transduction histidine kinase
LRQVLGNLLSNAFVHSPSGTRVRIRVRSQGRCRRTGAVTGQ